jgi:hypothetical protein
LRFYPQKSEQEARSAFAAEMRARLDQFTAHGTIRDAQAEHQPIESMAPRDALFVRNLESDIAR